MNENIKTKYHKFNLIIAIAISVVGLGTIIGAIFMKPLVVSLIFIIVGSVWLVLGIIGTLLQYFIYYEIVDGVLYCVRFKNKKEIDLDNILKILVYGTEFIIIGPDNKKFCKIDRGLRNADKILDYLVSINKEIIIKQF